ncbi:MAG: hypothetical protein K0Q68_1972 [Moraxellaceae bacterium]|nr:hypothetical protein [Moraxellaceae bacterium]
MAKPLDQFGGWLRFFQIVCWLNFAQAVAELTLSVLSLLGLLEGGDLALDAIGAAQYLILAICTFLMARRLPVQNEATPGTVFQVSTLGLGAALLGTIAVAFIRADRGGNGFWDHFQGTGALWMVALQFYIERSKRVLAYYGRNYGFAQTAKTGDAGGAQS